MPTQQFGGNAFLSELSEAEMAMFRPHLTLLDLRLDDSLHRVGDRVEHVVFPHSGLVATTLPSKDGAGAAIVLIGADGVIGATAAAANATVRESRALVARSRGRPYLATLRGEPTIREP